MGDNTAPSGASAQPLPSALRSSNENRGRRVHLELTHVQGPSSDPGAAALGAMEEGSKACTTLYVHSNEPQHEPLVATYRKVAAEAIATFVLVFVGCGSVVLDTKSEGAITLLGIALAFGLAIMAMVRAVGHISGAHMNPAVTIAFASVREFPLKLVPLYIAAQVGGSICAGFALRLMFDYDLDENLNHLGASSPANSDLQAVSMEFVITLVLMFVVSSVAVDSKAVGELAGLILGLTITMLAIVGVPVSGASMNPARTIGPAVAANFYKSVWVYVVGPIPGAVVGAWLYALVHGPQDIPSESHVRIKPQAHRRRRLQIGNRREPIDLCGCLSVSQEEDEPGTLGPQVQTPVHT